MLKPTNEAEEDLNKDYQADDDGEPLEYDDESDQNSNQKPGNCVESNAPAFFKFSDYTETVKAGESVTLKCEIENLIPKNVILWYKGDQKETQKNLFILNNRITPDDRFVYSESDHSLTINNVNETDQDVYLCYVAPNNITMKAKLVVLSNLEAHIYESSSITHRQYDTKFFLRKYPAYDDGEPLEYDSATIRYIPRVSAHRSVINTKEGDNAELYCDYDSTTESHVVWYKNQQKLQIRTHEPRSKYSVIYRAPKSPNKKTSILVVNNVKSTDLGVYECRVDNEIGTEKVTIELTYVPEPPKLRQVEREGDTVITHWHIPSMQKLQEIMLNYQLEGEINQSSNSLIIFVPLLDWLQEAVIDQEQSKEHTGIWKIKHKLASCECRVDNEIGTAKVTIELTYVPEPPKLHQVEREGDTVITHWHVPSMQKLQEIMLNYQLEVERDWLQEAVIDQEQSKEHTGIWKIKHKLALASGAWHVCVKSMNTEGWSGYSNLEDIPVPDKKMNSATTTMVSSCAISFAALLTIYSINWSTRLFG
ncbi:titin-like [Sitodiplosis mosellana]|uniref:titin-like n=1 Tax=Sitodiplosis mosellana TaxID=263140 RepID=UPI0024443C36|nr:titin-like [Sitodiplosis mosellana]